MTSYDWQLIQQRSGESIESLIATLLRRAHCDARQVNPSQGDGGVDILRPTADGLEVWQVKGFTTAISGSQFRQIESSWKRFVKQHVRPGRQPIARYHLVTAWTPTEERIARFKKLTVDAAFPCQWDGGAFIAGLADRFPETMQRFAYGEGVLEQFVSQKSMLASSPVEHAESISMLHAIETRQDALDALRDAVSDNYRIEHGTRTVANGNDIPLPADDDPAVHHRMTNLGDSRWKFESVVPRSADSTAIDPITLNVELSEARGTPGHAAVQEWLDWGTPFDKVSVRSSFTGGPLNNCQLTDSLISFVQKETSDDFRLHLRYIGDDGQTRLRLPLIVAIRTIGAATGWLRVLACTPERVLDFELRCKEERQVSIEIRMGDVEGRRPEFVRDEAEALLRLDGVTTLSIETETGQSIFRACDVDLSPVLQKTCIALARNLTLLQAHTASILAMPRISEVTDPQFDNCSALTSIYSGVARQWNWNEAVLQVPDEAAESGVNNKLVDRLLRGGCLVKVEEPEFQLGGQLYKIDHPLVSTLHSVQIEPGIDPTQLQPGALFKIVPGESELVTTAKLADWTLHDAPSQPPT